MARARRKREVLRRLGDLVRNAVAALVLFCLAAAGAGAAILYAEQTAVLPPVSRLAEYHPPVATQVFAADGSLLAEFYVEKRYLLPIERIPLVVRQAFIAAEDDRFYEHRGIDPSSIVRAMMNNVLHPDSLQGGSTITQQVVKALLLTPQRSYERKLKEMILAVRLERELGKDEILELYLNHIYLGSGTYGVAAAARQYFGKSVEDLALPEAAMLAGLPQAPSRYSPVKHWQRARSRQRYVLRRMAEAGFISAEDAEEAFRSPIALAPHRGNYLAAPYYVEQVRRELEERYGAEMLYEAGLRVYTAADVRMTEEAERALRSGLESLHRRRGGSREPVQHLDRAAMVAFLSEQKERLGENVPRPGYRGDAVVIDAGRKGARVQLGAAKGPLRVPEKGGERISARVGDVFRVRVELADGLDDVRFGLDPEPVVEGAITALDPVSGHVRVMVGGYDFKRSQFNRVVQAARQPGSAFKPFVYAAAFDRGFTPASIILDAPIAFRDNDRIWMPQNYEEKYYGPTTLRDALTFSRNVVTVKLAHEIGIPYLVDYLRRVGIRSPLGPNLSLALGAAEVSLLELVAAYGVFANQGRRAEPILITRIVDAGGRVLFQAAPQVRDAIPPATAFQITSLLESVVRRGTGWRVRALRRPVAGKTGTTNDLNDAWFVGYTPQLLCGVWVGFDEKRSLGKHETGGRVAAPIWLSFMQHALENEPIEDFQVPANITLVRIDPKTGRRALPDEGGSIIEVFRRGTEPALEMVSSEDETPPGSSVGRDFLMQEE